MPSLSLPPLPGFDQQASERLRRHLQRVVDNDIVLSVSPEKAEQYSMLRRAQHYWRGNQYLFRTRTSQGTVDWSPIAVGQSAYGRSDMQAAYNYTNNVYRGDGRKFIGVVGQRAPNVKAVPDIHGDEDQERRAKKAERILSVLRTSWKVNRLQRQIAFNQWNSTTCFIHVAVRADRFRYGITKEPRIVEKQVQTEAGGFKCLSCGTVNPVEAVQAGQYNCQQCGAELNPESVIEPRFETVPEIVGYDEYPNAMVEAHVCSALKVTTPFGIEDIEQAPWLIYEYEEDKGALISAYPELEPLAASEFHRGSGDMLAVQGSTSRAQQDRQNGLTRPGIDGRWLYRQVWLTPYMYSRVPVEDRQTFMSAYPDGVRLVFVGQHLVRVFSERLIDHWVAIKPDVSETLWADPIGKDMIPVQDVVNNFLNINVEAGERSIPATIANPRVIDIEQLRRFAGLPGELIPALPQAGASLSDSFVKLPVAEMKPDLASFAGGLIEQGRENSGILRPLFGGDSGRQTATEAEQKRVQALMQLNVPWDESRIAWEEAYLKGTMLFAKHVVGGVRIPGVTIGQRELDDLREVLEGGWHCESEEGMPNTWSQRRALMWELMSKPPDVQAMLGTADPDNKQKVLDAVGMNDWKVPYLDDTLKMKRVIKELLTAQPIFDPMQGPLPSIPVDPLDDPKFMLDVIRQWNATEQAGFEKKQNQQGYANVLAYAKQLRMMMAPRPMPGNEPQQQQQPQQSSASQPDGSSSLPPGTPTPALPGGPSEMAPKMEQLPQMDANLPIQ